MFSIEVIAVNHAPQISGTPGAATQGQAFSFTPAASDADGDTLSFTIRNKPGWTLFDSNTGTLSGTPAKADIGNYTNITLAVSDGTASSELVFSIEVTGVTHAPTTEGMSADVVGTNVTSISLRWSFASDSSADGIALSRDGTSLGRIGNDVLTYTDNNLNAGQVYRYTLTPYNDAGLSATSLYLDATTRGNTSPVFVDGSYIELIADTLEAGTRIRRFQATDAEADTLSYRLVSGNDESYFTLDKDSGELLVHKNLAPAAGRTYTLLVEVSDGYSVTATEVKIGIYANSQTGLSRHFYDFNSTVSSIDGLKSHADFPGNATSTSIIPTFDAPRDVTDTYGQNVQGYIIPPTSGEYTFWIAADDFAELNLSTDANPDNKVKIADLNSSSTYQQWTRYSSQKSLPVYLEAGKPYYISALMVEKSGADHLSVAWEGPNLPKAVIDGNYLRPALDMAEPTAPTNVRADKTSENSVLMQWNAASDNFGVTGYRIYNGDTLLGETSDTSITLTGLVSDKVYRLRVAAVDAIGNESRGGQIINVVINDYLAPTQPIDLTATDVGSKQVTLNWQASSDDSGTAVLYRITQDGVRVGTTYDTHFLVKGLTAGSDYAFYVEAIDHVGNVSQASNTLNLTTTPVDPAAPIFSRTVYHFAVASRAAVATVFGKMQASDPNNKAVTFALISENESSAFAIGADGVMSTATTFDSSQSSQYQMIVRASNGTQSTDIDVRVTVLSDALMAKLGAARELWTNQSGDSVASLNTTVDPALSDTLNNFETPSNIGNNYGQRVRALLRPAVSGTYSFWLASDDHSELYLSSDIAPDNAELIAKLSGWSNPRSWNDNTRIKTDIQLEAGHLYYLEARHIENGGGDHLSVAWRGGDISTKTLLGGDYIIDYRAFAPVPPQVVTARQSGFDSGGDKISLKVNVSEQHIGQPVTVYYGLRDGGSDVLSWQQSFALGSYNAAGEYIVEIPGVEAGQTYYLRMYIGGELVGGWSNVIIVTTTIIDDKLAAKEALPERISLTVNVKGVDKQLELHKHSVRSPNFQLLTFDDRRQEHYEEIYPLPEVRTYRGKVSNDNSELVSAVVDVDNVLHIKGWNGNRSAWTIQVSIADKVDTGAQGIATSSTQEITLDGDIPAASNNRLFVPQPGADFYNNLVRVSFTFKSNHINAADNNLINALAIAEATANELDFGWAQKTGLRWDTRGALIEFHGNPDDSTQPKPRWADAANFAGQFQTSSGAYCWGGGDWVGCVAKFSMHGAWMHEVGHNFNLGHGEAVDTHNHAMSMGFQLSNMQSREVLRRMQTGSRFKRAEPISTPMLPAAFKDYITVYENGTGTVAPLANDYDVNGDDLTLASFDSTTAQGGVVSRIGDTLYYTPPANFVGTDQFTYTVSDGQLATVGPVQIQVVPNGLAGYWSMEQLETNAVKDDHGFGHTLLAKERSVGFGFQQRSSKNIDVNMMAGDGVQGQGFSSPLILEEKKVKDAIGDTLLEHTFDPGQQSFTASLWFKYSNPTGTTLLMGKSNTQAKTMIYGGWEVRAEGQDLVLEVRFRDRLIQNNTVNIRRAGAIADNNWYQVVMVIDREENKLKGFLNGELFDSIELPASDAPIMAAKSYSSYSGGSSFKVGGHTESCEDGVSCEQAFDNVRVYHRALNDAEVRNLYQSEQ